MLHLWVESKRFLKCKISVLEHEVFVALFLDNRHRVIAYKELFRGTIDGASVYTREVVKEALAYNAAAMIKLECKLKTKVIHGRNGDFT